MQSFQKPLTRRHACTETQIQIAGGAGDGQLQFQRIATFKPPGRIALREQTHQQSIKSHLPPHALEIHALGLGCGIQPVFQRATKCE